MLTIRQLLQGILSRFHLPAFNRMVTSYTNQESVISFVQNLVILSVSHFPAFLSHDSRTIYRSTILRQKKFATSYSMRTDFTYARKARQVPSKLSLVCPTIHFLRFYVRYQEICHNRMRNGYRQVTSFPQYARRSIFWGSTLGRRDLPLQNEKRIPDFLRGQFQYAQRNMSVIL